MWSKQFVRAEIEEKNNCVVLTIHYNYYFLLSFIETYIFDTVEQAKTKLLIERSRDHLVVIGKDGTKKNESVI